MAKNPQFCEKVILDALDNISTPGAAQNLQAGAQLSILDAFDRGINRDAFIDILKEAMLLHTFTSRLSMVAHMKAIVDKRSAPVSTDELTEAVHEVTALCEQHRTSLIKQMDLVVQCPLEMDTQH